MTAYLVRHAKAGDREEWKGDDRLRPLTKAGYRQAEALVDQLKGYPIDHVVSSPYVRCVETVQPLADLRGLPVQTMEALAEGAGVESVLRLIKRFAGKHVVLCTHGDVMQETVEHLASAGVIPRSQVDDLAKGATWILKETGGRIVGARYLSPPR